MPAVKPAALLRALAQGSRGGVYLLHGADEYLVEELVERVVDAHLDATGRAFNLDQVRAGDTEPDTLATLAATPPMFGDWRVVVVRDAQLLAANARTRATIESLLGGAPGIALLFVGQLPDGKKRPKFWTTFEKRTTAVEVPSPSSSDLPGWLIERAAADGLELEPGAARALAAAVGPALGVLMQEIHKLRDYVGERAVATTRDVTAVVGIVPSQNRWDWIDMVGERRFAEARRALPVLLDAGESGVALVIGLGSQMLRIGIGANGGERALDALLPGNQKWLARRILGQARRWQPGAIDAALDDLLRADRLLKSTPLGDRAVLGELLLRLEAHDRVAA
ncbi:MAG TPA: DNA polymerase III subunit delta [Longimicrobiales bacterium]|nr:DNA polymerase III subunit delta [Longimicrobiales bacterium]